MRLFIIACFIIVQFSGYARAEDPRLKLISLMNFNWDMNSDRGLMRFDAPFFGIFTLEKAAKYYDCFDDKCDYRQAVKWLFSEKVPEYVDGPEPWFTISPYKSSELSNQQIDLAYVSMCSLPFNSLEDSVSLSEEELPEESKQAQRERRVAEKYFTKQFLQSIGAGVDLATNVTNAGLLTRKTNKLLRDAWLAGKLRRPALVWANGECGAGEIMVALKYAEPTSRAQVIGEFDYQVCRRFSLNPWDPDQCPHVRDVLGKREMFAGNYRFRLVRNSGDIVYKKYDVDTSIEVDPELTL